MEPPFAVQSLQAVKWVHNTAGGSGCRYAAVHRCCSASGVPFHTIWTKDGPAGDMYAVSDSGQIEKENYQSWQKKMFLPATTHQ